MPDISSFKKFDGSGVCDVCNSPIGPNQAYLVPVGVFYTSPKYKMWLRGNPIGQMAIAMAGSVDAYLTFQRSMDPTEYSAVCPNCINLFT